MFADYHVHTEFSDDSVYPMEDVIRDAVKMGMDEICITDHVDYGVKTDWEEGMEIQYRKGDPLTNVDYPRYMEKIGRLREEYGGKITIRTGMEFGVQTTPSPNLRRCLPDIPLTSSFSPSTRWRTRSSGPRISSGGGSQKEYNERYYQEMFDVVKAYKNYSVLGHMDLIKRYDEAGIYPFGEVEPMIREILKVVIADGKGIELNTSFHRYGLAEPMPSMDIFRSTGSWGARSSPSAATATSRNTWEPTSARGRRS